MIIPVEKNKEYIVDGIDSKIETCVSCFDEFDKIQIANEKPHKKIQAIEEQKVSGKKCSLIIKNLRSKIELLIEDDLLVGRNIDIFASDCVSESHCFIFYENNEWKIEHLSNTNPTWLNNISLEHNLPMVLRDGDNLKVADVFCKVNLILDCSNVKKDETCFEPLPVKVTENDIWEIVCPICGKSYIVENEKDKISVCTGSCQYDDVDKYEISNVNAKKKKG